MKVIAAVSEELFDRQPEDYRHAVLPPEARLRSDVRLERDAAHVAAAQFGPLTDAYSLTSDWDNQWLTGGLEADVIAEAHLDADSIFAGVRRFAQDRPERMRRQRALLDALG